jgi:inhibitor of KinA
MANDVRITAAGDSALVVEFDTTGSFNNEPNVDVNARAIALASEVRTAAIEGILDVVPTMHTVGVYFDALKLDAPGLAARLRQAADRFIPEAALEEAGPLHRIPVQYGGAFGPDLADVASMAGLSEQAVVSQHSSPVYRVFMLGFSPGFAYMGPVEASIAVPRRATPRTVVPVGSVAIAGRLTGVYPSESPGGWQLIGRTPVRPFDLNRAQPFLFKAGDRVQFYALKPERPVA